MERGKRGKEYKETQGGAGGVVGRKKYSLSTNYLLGAILYYFTYYLLNICKYTRMTLLPLF